MRLIRKLSPKKEIIRRVFLDMAWRDADETAVARNSHSASARFAKPEPFDFRSRRSPKRFFVHHAVMAWDGFSHREHRSIMHIFHARGALWVGAFRNHLFILKIRFDCNWRERGVITVTGHCAADHRTGVLSM